MRIDRVSYRLGIRRSHNYNSATAEVELSSPVGESEEVADVRKALRKAARAAINEDNQMLRAALGITPREAASE